MVKRFIAIASIMTLIIPMQASAAPTYGTDMPAKKETSVGYQANIVFDHELKKPYGSIRSNQHFLDISYGVADWFTLDGKIGVGNAIQQGGIYPKVDYRSSFAGGYGFRIMALDDRANRGRVVLGFHHISVHPESRNLNGDRYDAILDDWQCSVTASKDIGRFRPFAGIKAMKSDLICRVNDIDKKWRPPRYWGGVVAGCSIRLPDGFSIRVESRFIDETALSAGCYYTF
jgi:hypothetical protein